MAARFRKLDPRLWHDEAFCQCSIVEKLVSVYAITAQSNRIGLFSFSPGKACEDLKIRSETFRKGFEKVCQRFHWKWDSDARVLFIPTWWKYNCPENPNVLKACLSDLHDLPQTPLLQAFSDNLRHLPGTFHQTFREGLPKPSHQPSPNQEQEIGESRVEQELPPVDHEFEKFWKLYPARNGKRLDKPQALEKWQALSLEDRPRVHVAVRNYADSELARKGIGIKDPHRWLRNGPKKKPSEPWREWMEPEQRQEGRERHDVKAKLPRAGFAERDYREGVF